MSRRRCKLDMSMLQGFDGMSALRLLTHLHIQNRDMADDEAALEPFIHAPSVRTLHIFCGYELKQLPSAPYLDFMIDLTLAEVSFEHIPPALVRARNLQTLTISFTSSAGRWALHLIYTQFCTLLCSCLPQN